jgi:hypothetical protein
MTGIYLLVVGATWLSFVLWLSLSASRKLIGGFWRMPIATVIAVSLLPLPILDEIIGRRQFEQLCKRYAYIELDRTSAVGRTVFFHSQPDVEADGAWLRIVLQPRRFDDAATGEPVVRYTTLVATGGRFMNVLGISEGGLPLTFRGTCRPEENLKDLFKSLGITALDRPTPKTSGS